MPMLWQCCDNVIPMLWQYYDNVITMLSECYNIVMTLLWHCYDNVMTMFWQCCDNVMTMSPGRSFCFLSPLLFWSWSTGLFTRYTMCRPSCEERLAKSCKEVGSGGLYLPVAHIWYLLPERQQQCLCRKNYQLEHDFHQKHCHRRNVTGHHSFSQQKYISALESKPC